MTVISSMGQQWHKAQLAEKLSIRLQTESAICQLLAGATSLDTVCNLVLALAGSEQELSADVWDDGVMVALLFSAYRLLFVKATQQQLSQGEELIISIGGKLGQIVHMTDLLPAHRNQVELMSNLHQKLTNVRLKTRSKYSNMVRVR